MLRPGKIASANSVLVRHPPPVPAVSGGFRNQESRRVSQATVDKASFWKQSEENPLQNVTPVRRKSGARRTRVPVVQHLAQFRDERSWH